MLDLSEGLICAWAFDGTGGGMRLSSAEARAWARPSPQGFLWLHFRHLERAEQFWLRQDSGIDPSAMESMMEPEGRARCALFADGALLTLKGINLQRNALPEELITVHLWVDARRIISVQHEPLSAIADYIDMLARGRCPRSQGELVAELSMRLVDRLDSVVTTLLDEADELEDNAFSAQFADIIPKLVVLRRVAIKLRRHVAPQREALNHFSLEDDDWLGPKDRNRLRDAADRVTRFTEELEGVRERAALIRDHMVDRRAEQMNRSMLVLAAVTVVFAPMTLISGMFGMNVGGIPGTSDEGFWLVSVLLVLIGCSVLYYFRKVRWI